MAMISMGLVALMLATVQHIRRARVMRDLDPELPVFSPATLLALLFAAAGVFALVGVILQRP
jgi:hypothetical protein